MFGLVKIKYGDVTASIWLSFTFEVLEVVLGIICVCIPTLIPALTQVSNSRIGSYAKRLFTTSSSQTNKSGALTGSENPGSHGFQLLDRSGSQTALKKTTSTDMARGDPSFEEAEIRGRSDMSFSATEPSRRF